jgi:3-oxoacyl-[acyl-carrier-protein] synthase-3
VTVAPKGTGTIQSATGSVGSKIRGVGGYRPERVVPNSELVEAIDSSDEWIQERSGIISRRYAAPDESVVDMAEEGRPGRHRQCRASTSPRSTPSSSRR